MALYTCDVNSKVPRSGVGQRDGVSAPPRKQVETLQKQTLPQHHPQGRAMIRSKKITDSARGEDCTLQIVGICNGNPETVVFCHFPDDSHGMGIKSDDISGGYGCSSCHQALDQHKLRREDRDWYMRRSQTRTLRKLIEKGVVIIK